MAFISNPPKGGAACPPPSGGGFFGGSSPFDGLGISPFATMSAAQYARYNEQRLAAIQRAPCPPPIVIAKTDNYPLLTFTDDRLVINEGGVPTRLICSADTPWQAFCRELRQEMDE